MGIDVKPSGGPCGATVTGVDLTRSLSSPDVEDVRAACLEHHVLAFPEQPMTIDDLERFTLTFGPFGDDPFTAAPIPSATTSSPSAAEPTRRHLSSPRTGTATGAFRTYRPPARACWA